MPEPRYLLEQPDRTPLLSEEVLVRGASGTRRRPLRTGCLTARRCDCWPKPLRTPTVPMAEKRELMQSALESWPALERSLDATISVRAGFLRDSHRRVRQAVGQRVRRLAVVPQLPPDLLGMLVLQPMA